MGQIGDPRAADELLK
ncbi:MAG: hypothetical protein GF344_14705, partial [Chitinivibrionales bacterium]|nr:hypothetical protein [Chitinivibrionales bacterium]